MELCLPPSLLPSEEKEGERSSRRALNLPSLSFSPSRARNANATYPATALTSPRDLPPLSCPATFRSDPPPPHSRPISYATPARYPPIPPTSSRPSLLEPPTSPSHRFNTPQPASWTTSTLLPGPSFRNCVTSLRRRLCREKNTHARDTVRPHKPSHYTTLLHGLHAHTTTPPRYTCNLQQHRQQVPPSRTDALQWKTLVKPHMHTTTHSRPPHPAARATRPSPKASRQAPKRMRTS